MADPIQFLRKGVTVFTSSIYQTTSTLLETPNAVFLIDPNWLPFEIYRIREYVESVISDRKLYLVFTHSDYDHIIGRGAFPEARIIASKTFQNNPNKEIDIHKALEWDSQHYISREYSITYPQADIVIEKDGQARHYGGTVLTFYHAPGHTREGMMVVFEPAGVLIAGDYLSDVEFPLIEDSLSAYRKTMSKIDRIMRSHQIKWMIPGHGTVATSAAEIKLRQAQSIEYLDDLEQTLNTGSAFPVQKYAHRYQFWQGLQSVHQQQLARLSSYV